MTNEMKSFKGYLSGKRLRLSVVAIILGILVLAPLAAAAKNPNPGVLPVDSHAYGMTYGEWSAEWWKWAFSMPAGQNNPIQDTNGDFAAEGQSGKVWFLAGTTFDLSGQTVERSCEIPAGKALFFPVINSAFSELELGLDSSVDNEETLRAAVTEAMYYVTDIEASVDGKEIEDLENYRVQSDLFDVVIDPETIFFEVPDDCVDYETVAVSDGYWIMLAPLSVGEHTIHIYGRMDGVDSEDKPWVFVTDVIYHLTVVPGGSTK